MLFQGRKPHPAHQSFGDAVGAVYRHFETGEKPPITEEKESIKSRIKTGISSEECDIVIAEGTAPLQTLLAYKVRHPMTTAIYLAADETFYTLPERPTHYLWKLLGPIANRLLDGVIAVGRDVYNWARPYLGSLPVKYVHPPINDDKYDRLRSLEPQSPQRPFTILSVGVAKPANGYENLIPAVERLAGHTDIDIRVIILGKGHSEESYADSSVVELPGFVDLDTFIDCFSEASIYVQPSIGDAFPVATLEAILSGTPVLVTESVGVRELLEDAQVVDPSPNGLYSGIKRFFEMDTTVRRKLGSEQRELTKGFTESSQQERFREAVIDIHN